MKTEMEISDRLFKFIRGLDPELAAGDLLKQDTPLVRSGLIDSTKVYELIMFIEELYNISIAPEETIPENFDTIENMTAFIMNKIK